MSQIVITNLTKKYRKKLIFKDISLIITNNRYNFLIGPNGTGKSTFIKCILNEIQYDGIIETNKLNISYAPERIILPDYITVFDFLKLLFLDKVINNNLMEQKVIYYLELFAIKEYKDICIYKLSKGTRQKIILIQALMMNSDIYIFDEPFNGLDESSRKKFIEELKRLNQKKKLIIISTHYLKEYSIRLKRIFNFPLSKDSNETI